MSDALIGAIKIAMQPLAKTYALRVVGEENHRNYAAVKYANRTTGLEVAVDWSELRPFLRLYELAGGAFPTDPVALGLPGIRRRAFDVDDLLLLRPLAPSPVGKMLGRRDQHEASQLLVDYARALDQQASDVLSGNFAVFDELDQVVAQRERRLREDRNK
jgi:hypothetical protein